MLTPLNQSRVPPQLEITICDIKFSIPASSSLYYSIQGIISNLCLLPKPDPCSFLPIHWRHILHVQRLYFIESGLVFFAEPAEDFHDIAQLFVVRHDFFREFRESERVLAYSDKGTHDGDVGLDGFVTVEYA